ncbi:hypothetical protein [Acinetobacter shaoyimingii]|uniref:Uncharacterized protein n=1 Tax=Acinetobacter shaoyimingii TaxID=2715164 RepID=A0A6G8RT82_9GAMM|nr:hypothetical protein [Acinetobacter shaoyimingii]NHB59287.1 hypothetical protein [Acinetobacter shaoyimingii]QIO05101.1 hypothetical protein G8E00_03510 [Acinetobacter shaoyimingii]
MAFDLVQYFTEQIKIQKPQLFKQYSIEEQNLYISEINALTLGKLINLWRQDEQKIYQEIQSQDQLYIQEVARHLTTAQSNQSTLPKSELESSTSDILSLQLNELKQLDDTGNYKISGMRELLLGQIEHLSGQAKDWVWSTNELNELIGSQRIEQEELSLEDTMKEFNHMVNNQHSDDTHVIAEPTVAEVPAWAKVLEPVVALVILWILYTALKAVF